MSKSRNGTKSAINRLQRENQALKDQLAHARGINNGNSGRSTPNLNHYGTVIKGLLLITHILNHSHLQYHTVCDIIDSDRQDNIIALKKELRESNELLETAKTAHNLLVQELDKYKGALEKSKDELTQTQTDLAEADG